MRELICKLVFVWFSQTPDIWSYVVQIVGCRVYIDVYTILKLDIVMFHSRMKLYVKDVERDPNRLVVYIRRERGKCLACIVSPGVNVELSPAVTLHWV